VRELETTEARVENILKKLDKVPIQDIGDDLHKAIAQLDKTLVSAQDTLVSAHETLENTSNLTAPNCVQFEQLSSTQEISRAARSVCVLADYLERHPDALMRGNKREAK